MRKKLLSFALALALSMGLAAPAFAADTPTFSDVPKSNWAYTYVEKAAEKGWISGNGAGRFSPNDNVTYAQLCVMLVKAFFAEEEAKVQTEPWYYKYGFIAYQMKLIEGTAIMWHISDADQMNKPVSRYEMALMLYNTMVKKGAVQGSPDLNAAAKSTADWSAVPEKYRAAVAAAKNAGIINGLDAKGTFGGTQSMTRAQAAVVMINLGKLTGSNEYTQTPADPIPTTTESKPSENSSTAAADIYCQNCGFVMKKADSDVFRPSASNSAGAYGLCFECHKFFVCGDCMESTVFRNHTRNCKGDFEPSESFVAPNVLAPINDPESFSAMYRSSPYYRALQNVKLTGDYRTDIIAVAQSQIGYHEGNNENQLDGSYSGNGNYTEYGYYLDSNGSAWCSEFASWCARMANVPVNILNSSRSASVKEFGAPYYTWSQTVYAGGNYTPQPGDLALFAWTGTSHTAYALSHTTIVRNVTVRGDEVTITVIDGNSNGSVRTHDYTARRSDGYVGKGHLVYFVAPNYD